MKNFIYRSATVSPSGKIKIRFTTNPKVAEKLGGVLTCRSSSTVHPIPNIYPNLPALEFFINSEATSFPPLPSPSSS
jgi:hypothetical protein